MLSKINEQRTESKHNLRSKKFQGDSECLNGFHLIPGDIPGEGSLQRDIQTDDEGCGRLCQLFEECCSYEYSPNDQLCQLNEECRPNAEKHKDYNFCSKKAKGKQDASY